MSVLQSLPMSFRQVPFRIPPFVDFVKLKFLVEIEIDWLVRTDHRCSGSECLLSDSRLRFNFFLSYLAEPVRVSSDPPREVVRGGIAGGIVMFGSGVYSLFCSIDDGVWCASVIAMVLCGIYVYG
jgi:hypothetical protein